MLASNIIFPQQVFHCHLQSLYFKLYLRVTYMFYCSIKISLHPYLLTVRIVEQLSFRIFVDRYSWNALSTHLTTCINTQVLCS